MSKLFISALAFLVLSVGFTVFSAEDTKAATYGTFQSTPQISVISPDGTKNVDVSNNWKSIISNSSTATTCSTAMRNSLIQSDTSGSIGVFQFKPNDNYLWSELRSNAYGQPPNQLPRAIVHFVWSEIADSPAYIMIGDDYTDVLLNLSGGQNFGWLAIQNDGSYIFNCNSISYSTCSANTTTHLTTCRNITNTNWPLFAGNWGWDSSTVYAYYQTFDVEYPEDWDTPRVPTEPTIVPQAEIIRPDFSWVTTDLNMKITHIKKAELLPNGEDYQLGITVGFCPDGYSDVGALCDNYEALKYSVIDKGGTFSYDAYQYGDYLIQVEYVREVCTRYPSYPTTPDYCYYEYPQDTDDYDFESTEIRLNLGKQFSSSGSTIGQVCDVSGYCEAPSPYEDCSINDLNLGGYFECIIKNFGTWLNLTLQSLFIPNFGNVKIAMDKFTGSLQSQFGFLYRAFEMLLQWLNSLLTITPDCTVDFGNARFFGSPVAYNFCAFEQSAPNIANALFTTVRLVIAGTFIFIAYRRLLEIIKGLGR